MAGEIPYPQAPAGPTFTETNPLQMAGALQGLAQRNQAMEQQQQLFAAKQAVGKHMEAFVDPATGQLDNHGFLASLASDPAAQPAFMDVYHMMRQNAEIDERIMGQQILNQQNRLQAVSNMMTPLQRKLAEGEQLTEADLSGAIALGIDNGAFKNRDDGLKTLIQWTGATKNSPSMARNIVLGMSQFTDNARQALGKNMLDIETAYKMVPQVSESGSSFEQAARNVPGALPPGAMGPAPLQSEEFQQPEIAGEGAVAPRISPSARQEGQPSAPPAAYGSDIPAGAIRKSASPEMQQYVQYQKGEGWLRKEQENAAANLESAYKLESELKTQEKLLRQFEQGPGMETRTKIAEALSAAGAPTSLIDTVMGARGKGDAVAAAQAARKYIYGNSMTALKNALGPGQRFTNFELQTAQKSNYGLDTAKPAINVLMNDLHRIIQIAKEEAEGVEHYTDKSLEDPRNRKSFNQIHYQTTMEKWLKHKGLLSEGPFDVNKEPGE